MDHSQQHITKDIVNNVQQATHCTYIHKMLGGKEFVVFCHLPIALLISPYVIC